MKTSARLIKADIITSNGNLYPKHVLEKAVRQISERVKKRNVKVHFMSKMDLTPIGKPAAELIQVELDDGEMIAHLESTSSRSGKIFESLVQSGNIRYLPVIEAGLNQPVIMEGKTS